MPCIRHADVVISTCQGNGHQVLIFRHGGLRAYIEAISEWADNMREKSYVEV
jgi:hypothetical protein